MKRITTTIIIQDLKSSKSFTFVSLQESSQLRYAIVADSENKENKQKEERTQIITTQPPMKGQTSASEQTFNHIWTRFLFFSPVLFL